MRDFFDILIEAASDQLQSFRSTALTDEIDGYVVDTVRTPDCGWETGLQKDGRPWVIVEYYKNQEAASSGHVKWCEFVRTKPKRVNSVQTGFEERL